MTLLARERSARYATAELALEDLARCANYPPDGRRELVELLAARFPAEVGPPSPAVAGSDHAVRSVEPASPSPPTSGAALEDGASPAAPGVLAVHGGRRRWLIGMGVAAAASLGTLAVTTFAHTASAIAIASGIERDRASDRDPVPTGELIIDVTPRAQVWVDDARIPAGQTPLHLELRTGRHRIRLTEPRGHKETIVPVIINAEKVAVIDVAW